MTLFIIMVPLMVAAIAIATVPVLYHSVREDRLIRSGSAETPRPQADNGYSIGTISSTERQTMAA